MSAGSCQGEILTLWQAHRRAELPDVPQESKGELWVLDEVIGGCVSFYLSGGGVPDHPRVAILEDCRTDLERLLPDLDDGAASYFSRLDMLAGLLIAMSGNAGEQGTRGR